MWITVFLVLSHVLAAVVAGFVVRYVIAQKRKRLEQVSRVSVLAQAAITSAVVCPEEWKPDSREKSIWVHEDFGKLKAQKFRDYCPSHQYPALDGAYAMQASLGDFEISTYERNQIVKALEEYKVKQHQQQRHEESQRLLSLTIEKARKKLPKNDNGDKPVEWKPPRGGHRFIDEGVINDM